MAVPEVGLSKVASICIIVVLPAPFEPRRPKISFSCMSRFSPSTAIKFWYRLTRFRIIINHSNSSWGDIMLMLGYSKHIDNVIKIVK